MQESLRVIMEELGMNKGDLSPNKDVDTNFALLTSKSNSLGRNQLDDFFTEEVSETQGESESNNNI